VGLQFALHAAFHLQSGAMQQPPSQMQVLAASHDGEMLACLGREERSAELRGNSMREEKRRCRQTIRRRSAGVRSDIMAGTRDVDRKPAESALSFPPPSSALNLHSLNDSCSF